MRDCKILEQLMLAMESASLCVRVDANGHIVWVSETLKQLDSQHVISPGLPLSKLLHTDVRGQLLDQFDYSVTQQSHWQATVKLNQGIVALIGSRRSLCLYSTTAKSCKSKYFCCRIFPAKCFWMSF